MPVEGLESVKQEWEPYDADTDRMVEGVLKEYDNPAQAIEFNVIQNSWDARIGKEEPGPWPEWRCEMTYYPERRQLWIEDFGTTGIEHWDKYRGIGFTSKDLDEDVGGHGEGSKALAAVARRVYTETVLRDGKKRCDLWERGRRSRNPPDLGLLSHVGALIIVDGVLDEANDQPVHSLLSDDEYMIREIQISWDEIIRAHGAKITYRSRKETVVPPLDWPEAAFNQDYGTIEVNTRTKVVGTVRGLRLVLAAKDAPDVLRGLHLRVHGQTVMRYVPPFLGSTVAPKFYGWCSLDYLARSKMRGHQGFMGRNWGETKRVLDRVVQEFREKYASREAETESRYRKMSSALLRQINACLQAVPELDPSGTGKRIKKPIPPPTSPEIDTIDLGDRDVRRGETVEATVVTVNRVAGRSFHGSNLRVSVLDPHGLDATTALEEDLDFDPGDRKETDVEYAIPETADRGRYVISASLTGPSDEVYDTATASFDVDPDPEPPATPSDGDVTSADKTKHRRNAGKARGLREVRVGRFRVPPGEPVPESALDEDRLVLAINSLHPSWRLAERQSTKSLWMYVARCAANELASLKLERETIAVVQATQATERGLGELEDKLRAIQQDVVLLSARFTGKWAELNLPPEGEMT